jgi:hypothetical protein
MVTHPTPALPIKGQEKRNLGMGDSDNHSFCGATQPSEKGEIIIKERNG